jgi:hypothetical protein
LEGWQGSGDTSGTLDSGVLPNNNVSNNRRFMPLTTGVIQISNIGSGVSGEDLGFPLINNSLNLIKVPEYGFRTDVDCLVTGMSFQTIYIDPAEDSLFKINRTNPTVGTVTSVPSEVILGVEITDVSFGNVTPATKYKIGTILYGPTNTTGTGTYTTTSLSGEVYFFTNESFVRVPANRRIHPFVGFINSRTTNSGSGYDLIYMYGSQNGIFNNVNSPNENYTGYARVKLYIHNYFGQKKEINVTL